MSDPTNPPNIPLESVSNKLVLGRMIVGGVSSAIVIVAALILALLVTPWLWIGVAGGVILLGWLAWLIPRQVHNIGYATEEKDFVVRRGALFRSLNVIPYGRIQFVDVSEGPIERALGISTLRLHTASATTDATVPGLSSEQANGLRQELVKRGAGKLSGL